MCLSACVCYPAEVTYSDDKQCDDKQPEVETVTAGAAVLQVRQHNSEAATLL